jgi:hypothetical protein
VQTPLEYSFIFVPDTLPVSYIFIYLFHPWNSLLWKLLLLEYGQYHSSVDAKSMLMTKIRALSVQVVMTIKCNSKPRDCASRAISYQTAECFQRIITDSNSNTVHVHLVTILSEQFDIQITCHSADTVAYTVFKRTNCESTHEFC